VGWLILVGVLVCAAGVSLAHITPPVTLLSDREAVLDMTGGASRFFVREVRLTPAERDMIAQQWQWYPEDEIYRFYLGRDNTGQLVAAVTFLTEFTIHGPVRVAVGLGPDGTVRDARVVELTEETFPWLKPLIDHNFTRAYVGQGSRASFRMGEELAQQAPQSMSRFYGDIVTSLIQRAAVLFEVTVLQRDKKS
jgi:hypothetical protein